MVDHVGIEIRISINSPKKYTAMISYCLPSLTVSDLIFVLGCVLADTSSHSHTSNLVSSAPVAEASNVYTNQAQADNSLYYNNYQQQDPYNQGYYDYAAEDQSLFPSQEADRYDTH